MYTKIFVSLEGSSLDEQFLTFSRIFVETYGIPVELLRVNNPDTLLAIPSRHITFFQKLRKITWLIANVGKEKGYASKKAKALLTSLLVQQIGMWR